MNQAPPVTSTNMSSFAQVGVKTDLHFACCRGDPKLIIEAVKKVISLALAYSEISTLAVSSAFRIKTQRTQRRSASQEKIEKRECSACPMIMFFALCTFHQPSISWYFVIIFSWAEFKILVFLRASVSTPPMMYVPLPSSPFLPNISFCSHLVLPSPRSNLCNSSSWSRLLPNNFITLLYFFRSTARRCTWQRATIIPRFAASWWARVPTWASRIL